MKKTILYVISILVGTLVISAIPNAVAQTTKNISAITIRLDGTIDPSTAPILQSGYVYTLTGDIVNLSIDIQCSNITFDGAGYTVYLDGLAGTNSCVTVNGNYVTVKNLTIKNFDTPAITVSGAYNLIENNSFVHDEVGIIVVGSYNTLRENNAGNENMEIALHVKGNYNNVTQNCRWGVYTDGSYNTFTLNTIYFFYTNGTHNEFFDNNFQVSQGFGGNLGSNDFYFNGLGNYWSNYNGTDSNCDGIGDTPYEGVPNVTDLYPLMQPYGDTISESFDNFALEFTLIILIVLVITILSIFLISRRKSA